MAADFSAIKAEGKTMVDPVALSAIRLKLENSEADKTDFYFTGSFRIGRGKDCDVRVTDATVSRSHAEIFFEAGSWWVRDLQSANGTFLNERKVERAPLPNKGIIRLGVNGPVLALTIEGISQGEATQMDNWSFTHYVDRYTGDSTADNIGQHTMMIRRTFEQLQKRQKRRFAGILAVVVCLFLAAGTYAVIKHLEVRKHRLLAESIFYSIKSLELEFAGFLKMARLTNNAQAVENVNTYRAQRKKMEANYDQFVDTLGVYGEKISEEERIILRIARAFGECELNMPAGFSEEVFTYIKKWESSKRLEEAIDRARRNRYVSKISETLAAHDLPPQFFYLALQESNFDVNACGPKTKYGIAKGLWQFIPSTAVKYGLRVGPLVEVRGHDPRDERHHFGRSTLAAARYLRDIYDTEAQASGLLVIASYNWGERRIIELIRTMPKNPRERNFWRLLLNHKDKIPKETYDYVFYILSAAVIGENPGLFGFDFENPLAPVKG
jgi:membrane-bound lytic murein transglycosylase D